MEYGQMFKVKPGDRVNLGEIDPDYTDTFKDKTSAGIRRKIHSGIARFTILTIC